MPSPDAIPSLDETKYPQGINTVAQRNSVGKHYTLSSFDVRPGSFLFKEVSIEKFPTKVI
jgi:hypothetical protein